MHETIEALNAYVDNEVSAAERARIDAHLAACVDCASRKALLEQASASVGALPAPTLTAEESRRIRQGVLGRTRRRSARHPRLRPAWAGALALVVAGPGAGSQGAAPTAPKVMADAGRTEVPPAAPEGSGPERSATDCLAERQHDQADIRPVLSRPATYTGRAAWLLVYVAPAPSPSEPE